jgi:hypothetical protein
MSADKATQKSSKSTTASGKRSNGFTDVERAAMRERAQELKAEARRGPRGKKDKADGEGDVLAKIAEMPQPDRRLAERVHAVVTVAAPDLSPKLWYGQPAYAQDGQVVCFFRSAQKDQIRYSTFGFNERANLDDGGMWPTAYALTELSEADEAAIGALVKKAVN